MKFIEAIKALGPGQLLRYTYDPGYKSASEVYELRGDHLVNSGGGAVNAMAYLMSDSWSIEDKPRPRVKFADAMRAALEGKVIRSISEMEYKLTASGFVFASAGDHTYIGTFESKGDWEIIEAEDGK